MSNAQGNAAQEAVGYVDCEPQLGNAERKVGVLTSDVPEGSLLYAAPVTAAPVSVTRDADGEIVMVKQGDTIIASTCHAGGKAPAAPGIDLSILARDIHHAIADAGLAPLSPTDNHTLREVIRSVIDASPKGGSEARDAARYRFLRELAHHDPDDVIAVTIQKQDLWGNWRDMHLHGPELDAATDAAMQAQAGDAEVQP